MTTSKEKETEKKPLKLNRPGRLELKKTVETGQVRQSFSHGRSKAVTVEVKRSRTFAPGAGGRMTEVTAARQAANEALADGDDTELETRESSLTADERATRAHALELSRHEEEERRRAEAEARQRAQEEAARRAEEEARRRVEDARAEARRATEAETAKPEAGIGAEAEAAKPAEAEAAQAAPPETAAPARPGEAKRRTTAKEAEAEEAETAARVKRKGAAPAKAPPARRGGEGRRRQGKLTISQALEGGEGRQRSLASVRRQREKLRG
ncbi:MAG TPA: translation initiation factor IF-2 associated domain-containing protein, partial [Kiloniellales bacterium]|nr:translation initiation factor IF-2 associated domain-containing protein [Kiloniellales bacterium]